MAPATAWQEATVVSVRPETARARTIRLRLAVPSERLAGQHFVVRLTAPDGYRASRSYSVASPPPPAGEAGEIELTVERLEEGEVSTFLHDEVRVGDVLEVRGPIGGWFVWRGDTPAVLVGGGSGVVPLMSMLRLARATGRAGQVRMLVSVRSPADLLYASELPGPEAVIAYTRTAPAGYGRPVGRLRPDDIAPLALPGATFYVCGSSGFADSVTGLLAGDGVPPAAVRVERFGPTG